MKRKFGELPHRNTGPELALSHPFSIDDGTIGAKCVSCESPASHRVSAGTNVIDAQWTLSLTYTETGRALRRAAM